MRCLVFASPRLALVLFFELHAVFCFCFACDLFLLRFMGGMIDCVYFTSFGRRTLHMVHELVLQAVAGHVQREPRL